jgi:hypothetical protein
VNIQHNIQKKYEIAFKTTTPFSFVGELQLLLMISLFRRLKEMQAVGILVLPHAQSYLGSVKKERKMKNSSHTKINFF